MKILFDKKLLLLLLLLNFSCQEKKHNEKIYLGEEKWENGDIKTRYYYSDSSLSKFDSLKEFYKGNRLKIKANRINESNLFLYDFFDKKGELMSKGTTGMIKRDSFYQKGWWVFYSDKKYDSIIRYFSVIKDSSWYSQDIYFKKGKIQPKSLFLVNDTIKKRIRLLFPRDSISLEEQYSAECNFLIKDTVCKLKEIDSFIWSYENVDFDSKRTKVLCLGYKIVSSKSKGPNIHPIDSEYSLYSFPSMSINFHEVLPLSILDDCVFP